MSETTRTVYAWVSERTGDRRTFSDLHRLLAWARSGDHPPQFHVEMQEVRTTRTPWQRIEVEER